VDEETYGEFAEAKTVRDRLNEQARAAAKQQDTVHYQVALVGPDQWEIHTLKPQYIGESVDGIVYSDPAAAKAAADLLEQAGLAA
jgi:hypothetical protein